MERLEEGYSYIVGCDEAGIGPLAGPVVAAACILDPASVGARRSKNKWYARVRDSKTTSEEEREVLLAEILKHAVAYGVGEVWQDEIDRINIHHASLRAMRLAVEDMFAKSGAPAGKAFLIVDGRFTVPELQIEQESLIDADASVLSVAAASIIAKVHRDGIMRELDARHPGYGFARHKGYGTAFHRKTLKKLGPSAVHRRSFI